MEEYSPNELEKKFEERKSLLYLSPNQLKIKFEEKKPMLERYINDQFYDSIKGITSAFIVTSGLLVGVINSREPNNYCYVGFGFAVLGWLGSLYYSSKKKKREKMFSEELSELYTIDKILEVYDRINPENN